ncbi:MAG TPA: MarR family transcriptional regulator [Candidatus Acidoferrales bacterium]|nr:MarR family transcriptional regulator [Candidatus Acidoferrales bacterium]
MTRRMTQKEKTQRAFGAYLDLVDTADWIRRELVGPLDAFGLTMNEFRLLAMLYRDGPMSVGDAAEKRGCSRQNMHVMIARMEGWGWVRRKIMAYAPAEIKDSRLPKANRGKPRVGPRVSVVSLAPAGEKLVGRVLPKQAKVVKSLMRALQGREQRTMSRLCHKLREGDILKFISEIRHRDVDEEGK